jgi:hypothetical protein
LFHYGFYQYVKALWERVIQLRGAFLNANVEDCRWKESEVAKVMKGSDFGVAGDLIH